MRMGFNRVAKRDKGNLFAKENGYPELVNVLQPRTRGFVACLSQLRGSLDAGELSIGLIRPQLCLMIRNIGLEIDQGLERTDLTS